MKACPHCNGTGGYTVKVRAIGHNVHTASWDGLSDTISDDSGLRFVAEKTGKCLDCGKRFLMKRLRESQP